MDPSGFEPNLPPATDNRAPMLLQATWIEVGIATPFLLARLYARRKQMGKLSLDDYLMALSLVLGIISAGVTTGAVRWGFGRHVYYLTTEQALKAGKLAWINLPFTFASLTFGRVSFAVSLLTLIGTIKWRRWLLYFVIVCQLVANFLVIGVGLGLCSPVRRFWDRTVPGTCIDPRIHENTGFAQSAINIFSDLVLAVMPAWVISKLKLRRKAKIGLMVLMILGLFNMIAAVVTLVTLSKVKSRDDFTWVFVVPNIWGFTQGYLVIVIASIPFLRPLFFDTKAFSWSYYRSLFSRYAHGSRHTNQIAKDSEESDSILYELKNKPTPSLPRVPKERFVTTTLRNAGMETGFDRLGSMEYGQEGRTRK